MPTRTGPLAQPIGIDTDRWVAGDPTIPVGSVCGTSRPLLVSGALLLAACAPTFTPQQEWVMDNFESCRTETKSWNARLDRVEADGRMHVSAAQTPTDISRILECMKERQQR